MVIKADLRNILTAGVVAAIIMFNAQAALAAGGDLDTTFDGNGRLATDFDGGEDLANDVVVQSNGKIVAIGTSFSGGCYLAAARYNASGALDLTFSGDGKVSAFIGSSCSANAVAVQTDGKIVIAGSSFDPGGSQTHAFRLARYNVNGTPDTTFDGDGFVITFGDVGSSAAATALAIQPDGKIVVVGASYSSGLNGVPVDWRIVRYNANGSLDTTFSGDGIVTIDFGGNTGETAQAVAIMSNGKILVGGTGNPGGSNFALALLTTNGSLDTGFDGDGKVITDFPGTSESAYDMQVRSDGKIVLAGGTGSDTALARYNANGTLDNTFDGDGMLVVNVYTNGTDRARQVALQLDGKIVVAVTTGPADFYVLRLDPDGSRDSRFGSNGLVTTDMLDGSTDRSNAVALQPDGKIVVAGSTLNTSSGSTTNFCLARYLGGGNPDFDFDGDGRTDYSVFRPAQGAWYLQRSTAGFQGLQFGASGDRVTPADYDGDGTTDIAIYRPSTGSWFILKSSTSTVDYPVFGAAADIPAPGDLDGDGKADLVLFRPSQGIWYRVNSSNGSFFAYPFGQNGDVPTVGDFDGDGRNDYGIFRPSIGDWYHVRSSDNGLFGERFGQSGDRLAPADYDGDGKTDIAIWRPSTGLWVVRRSSTASYSYSVFGSPGDIPISGDYDGDGKADIGVWRPSDGTWYVQRSSNGSFLVFPWGQNGDVPTPAAFGN